VNVRVPGTGSAFGRRGLALIAAAVVCIGCATPSAQVSQEPSVSGESSSSAAPSTAAEASGASGAPAASAFPTPTDILPPGSLARVVVNDLRIREEPSLTGKVVATVGVGEVLWTGGFSSRTQADGIDWYSVAWLAGYTAWPAFPQGDWSRGWVALGAADQRYLELQAPRCPDGDPGLDQLAVITDWERLACFGGNSLTLTGTFGCVGCGGTAAGTFEPAWLAIPWDGSFLSAQPEVNLLPVVLHFAPDSGILRPLDGSTVRVTAHMNDPVSTTCVMGLAGEIEANRRMAELFCRERFVVDTLEVTGTDPNFPV
jgi:hypothetical protein